MITRFFDPRSATDYYPYGMAIASRSKALDNTDTEKYPYGFGGQQKSDEIDAAGNSYTAQFWQYDARIGRRWNIDPVDQFSISNYAAFGNNPVSRVDPLGDHDYAVLKDGDTPKDKPGNVTLFRGTDGPDRYYAVDKDGIKEDENCNITNKLIVETEGGALRNIRYNDIIHRRERKNYSYQVMDFGDNFEAADRVYKAIAVYSNVEFMFSTFSKDYNKISGKNVVTTSYQSRQVSYTIDQRNNDLVRNSHYHPILPESLFFKYNRFGPSDPDIDFRDKIIKRKRQARIDYPLITIPSAEFYIYLGKDYNDINYSSQIDYKKD